MTKEELEKEARDYADNQIGCGDGYYEWTDIENAYLAGAEPREKRIEALERKLEQTEKDLTDYQFNYPKIKDLEKENGKLLQRITQLEKDVTENESDCSMCDFPKLKQDLEKENAELRKVVEFQQSSNISRHFENKKLKEGLAVGSTFNKALNSMNKNLEEERDKYRNIVFDKDEQLTKAKEILQEYIRINLLPPIERNFDDEVKLFKQAEQFISEVEK